MKNIACLRLPTNLSQFGTVQIVAILICFLSCPIFGSDLIKNGGVVDVYTNDMFTLLTNPPHYNKWVPPQHIRPLRVNISILLFGFGSIDEVHTEFNLQLLLRITWSDERLCPWDKSTDRNITTLEGGSWHMDRLWRPSIHVPNSKVPDILQDTTQNPVLARIQSDGQILVSKRINLAGNNQMDFRLYPLDTQTIKFEIESNELSSDNLKIFWTENIPIDMTDDFTWSGYDLIDYRLKRSTSNYTHTGTFSKVRATFYLRRSFGHILLDVYIPIILSVATSWCSFWIEITAAPARVTLGVTIMLTMVTTSKLARDKLPPVSYIHALDIWIIVSIFFVFASLIEYTSVNYIYFREKRAKLKKMKRMKSKKKHEKQKQRMANRKPYETTDKKSSSLYLIESDNCGHDDNNMNHVVSNPNYHTDLTQLKPAANVNVNSKRFRNEECLNRTNYFISRFLCCLFDSNNNASDFRRTRILDGCEEIAIEIDRISRMIFPLTYLLFNLIYWMVIVVCSQQSDWQ